MKLNFIWAGVAIVGIVGSTAASCDQPVNGQLPSQSRAPGVVPDNGSVISQSTATVGGVKKFYVHVKTDNIADLAMEVNAAEFARCTIGKVFPECETP